MVNRLRKAKSGQGHSFPNPWSLFSFMRLGKLKAGWIFPYCCIIAFSSNALLIHFCGPGSVRSSWASWHWQLPGQGIIGQVWLISYSSRYKHDSGKFGGLGYSFQYFILYYKDLSVYDLHGLIGFSISYTFLYGYIGTWHAYGYDTVGGSVIR